MDYVFEKAWKDTVKKVSDRFGQELDYAPILMLIGLQELGKDYQTFKKDQKIDLMHIGICTVLIPYGYYSFVGRDPDGWPHFEKKDNLPPLAPEDQELLIKKAIVQYFADL